MRSYERQKSYGGWGSVSQVKGGEPVQWLADRVFDNRTPAWFGMARPVRESVGQSRAGARVLVGIVRGSFHRNVKRPGVAGRFSLQMQDLRRWGCVVCV